MTKRGSGGGVEEQVSSGGVVWRVAPAGIEVALVLVGDKRRWQLPKGIVEAGEAPEVTAVREAREEAGVDTRAGTKLDTIEYWYVASRGAARIRYHKFVHFFLLEYTGGDVADHDHEVLEARWVAIGEAPAMLAFENERKVVALAAAALAEQSGAEGSGRA